MQAKVSTCTFCDGGCQLKVTGAGPDAVVEPADPQAPAICSKAPRWSEIRLHEVRITHPLKNIGVRGEPIW